MNTNPLGAVTRSESHCKTARVWLVAGLAHTSEPADRPAVRDDLMRTWFRSRAAVTALPTAGVARRGRNCTPGSISSR